MKKILLQTIASLPLLLSVDVVLAQTANQVTFVNHYNKPLHFIVGLNPETLPNLPKEFDLDSGKEISSAVLPEHKQAYVRAEDDTKVNNGFFGVGVENGVTTIHGYVSKNIAFSWINEVVTFCTPEEYKQKQSC